MTNEERLARMKELAESGRGRTCETCRWRDGGNRTYYCYNPVRKAYANSVWASDFRGISGLCGPDALLWEQRGFFKRLYKKIASLFF